LSKYKVPAAIAPLYQEQRSADERTRLLKGYRDWQESRFSRAHYEYLERQYQKTLDEYVNASWLTRFAQRNFIAENKAKLQLLRKLKDTFLCEEI